MTPDAPCPTPAQRTLPDHGTTARYDGDPRRGKPPCRCAPCCNAERLRAKRARLVGPLTVNAAPVAAAGLAHNVMSLLVNGKVERVFRSTAVAIAGAYDRMCMTPGTSARNRDRAAREGWAPPLAWGEGHDIDDPRAVPFGHVPVRRTSADLTESSDELLALGVPMDVIAERLGVRLNTLVKARERTCARERAAALAAPEPT